MYMNIFEMGGEWQLEEDAYGSGKFCSKEECDLCNMLKCPPGRLSDFQCYNMFHSGHVLNL